MPAFNLLYLLYQIIHLVIGLYTWVIFLSALITWFPTLRASRAAYWLHRWAEPLLGLIQRFVPPIVGIDFSPWIALIVLQLADRALFAIFVQLL